ncbi:MAG: hypothetical protein ACLRWP_19465 [Bilophila wadsworthia]
MQLNGDCIDVIQGDPVYLFIYIDITDITEQRVLRRSWRSVRSCCATP